MSRGPGKFYLVGAGPGDPGLLTRRGEAVLSLADVVVYDHLASARLLDLAPADAVRICAGKSIGHCTLSQDEINEVLIEHARAGRIVVRLKGGDPLVFGRGAEEALQLRAAGIPFEIVPGVTAGVGVTAYAGIPVTHRAAASAVAFVTGHGDPESEPGQQPARLGGPGAISGYAGRLHGRHSPRGDLSDACCAWASRATRRPPSSKPGPSPRSTPWSRPWRRSRDDRRAERRRAPPALLVVGAVVALREELAWYERLPLFGQRIVITRPDGGSQPRGGRTRGTRGRSPAGADGPGAADHRPGASRRRHRAARGL